MNVFIGNKNYVFSGNKDYDLRMMSYLEDDRDLFNVCSQKNKYIQKLCSDKYFWRDRFIRKYGEKASQYKPEERSWKNHYLQVKIDLGKFENNIDDFLFNIYWRGNFNESYYKDGGNYIPLKEAPEWLMTNLYLLDTGIIKTAYKVYNNLKPVELLEEIYKKGLGNRYMHLNAENGL